MNIHSGEKSWGKCSGRNVRIPDYGGCALFRIETVREGEEKDELGQDYMVKNLCIQAFNVE